MITKEAIILAGGEGTRLQGVVPGIPKTLAPVNGKPFLDYILKHLLQTGIQRFIFAIGKAQDQITTYLQNQHGNLDHQVVIEESPLGTGGAITNALQHCKGKYSCHHKRRHIVQSQT
jgi:D-glycero-alpha-D-manno-heptose 1-phosphate guanylyltransferase